MQHGAKQKDKIVLQGVGDSGLEGPMLAIDLDSALLHTVVAFLVQHLWPDQVKLYTAFACGRTAERGAAGNT